MWNGGKVHRIRSNILHLMRGQIYTIEGKTFFTFGGAFSIDRLYRKKNISYWEEEIPSSEEYNEAIQHLEACNYKVDVILTHTAPREIVRRMGYMPIQNDLELTGFLEYVMYQTEFTHWYFGHWHFDKKISESMTALWFDIKRID